LRPLPSLEINGYAAIQQLRSLDPAEQSCALCHWRCDYLDASARNLPARGSAQAGDDPVYEQVIVAAQRDRQATLADGIRAWNACREGGQVLLHGGNDIGIRSSAQQLARLLGVPSEVLSSRAHARVVRYQKPPMSERVCSLEAEFLQSPSALTLATPPAVFAAGRLDRGTAVMLQAIELVAAELEDISSIADLGCGSGVLAIEAAQRWPGVSLYAADADARAVAATQQNMQQHGLAAQAVVTWWDSAESLPWPALDVVLTNPPWHVRGQVDRGPGLRMCEAAGKALKPGGKALIVATVTQPFERSLQAFGDLKTVLEADGFKVLLLRK
jgi:16S rRNA (guanine1207-N2)-methyltransferase